jgi:hypothetical protein
MKQTRRNEQGTQALVAAGWSAASFRIRTADGWLEVDGIVRPPFGIDQRATDETSNRSWFVTHLPSGLAVVSQVTAVAVATALTDRIAALTDWEAQNISATPELREQVREPSTGPMVTSSQTGCRRSQRMLRPPPEREGLCHCPAGWNAPIAGASVPPQCSHGATTA